MKKKLALIVGIFMISFCNAQDSLNFFSKRNEFNIGYLNILSLGTTNTFGVGYKIKIKNSALRIRCSFNYIKNIQTSSTQSSTYNSIGIIPEIGYEFRLNFKRSMVFYGLDLCGTYKKNLNNNSSSTYSYKEEEKGYGISPFIGYKYFINKNISISTETSFDFLYKNAKRESTYNNNNSSSSTSINTNQTLYANLSPLGIFSINIHF